MRIPPSVVVMSLITAVPFGLAIRDTVRHPSANADALDFDGSHARAREMAAQQQRWEQAAREAEARHAAARTHAIHQIYGAAPATLGHAFDGIHFGDSPSAYRPEAASEGIQTLEGEADVMVEFDSYTRLQTITVDLGGACDEVATQLRAAWGPSPTGTWRAPDGQRARLDVNACTLTFDRTLPATAWIDRATLAIVPLGELGKPASDLDAYAADYRDDSTVDWHGPGLGAGEGPTEIRATVDGGEIVELTADVDTDPASIQAVQDRLTALLHVPPKADEDGALIWKGPIVVALEIDDTHLRLSADARP